MQSKELFKKIRDIVSRIPSGKVASYGQIAEIAGIKDARIVGWAIKGNKDPKIPCHRLVRADGFLALNYSLGDWREDKTKLEAEGIKFVEEAKVDMSKYQWEGKISAK